MVAMMCTKYKFYVHLFRNKNHRLETAYCMLRFMNVIEAQKNKISSAGDGVHDVTRVIEIFERRISNGFNLIMHQARDGASDFYKTRQVCFALCEDESLSFSAVTITTLSCATTLECDLLT